MTRLFIRHVTPILVSVWLLIVVTEDADTQREFVIHETIELV